MTWSKTQPTEPGWYWIRLNGTTGACAVEYPDGGADLLVSFAGVEGAYALFDITIAGAEWCGPLEEPMHRADFTLKSGREVEVSWPSSREWMEWSFVRTGGKGPMDTDDKPDPDEDEIGQLIQEHIAEGNR